MNNQIKELTSDAMFLLHECRQANFFCLMSQDKQEHNLKLLHDKLNDLELKIEEISDTLSKSQENKPVNWIRRML